MANTHQNINQVALADFPRHCTVKVARDVWNIHPTKLPNVSGALGIALKRHHRASYDALACARIVQKALQQVGQEQFAASYLAVTLKRNKQATRAALLDEKSY